MPLLNRTPELNAELERLEATGEFEQQGYLMAPALCAATGDSYEQMIVVAQTILSIPGQSYNHIQRANGLTRWCMEQMENSNEKAN